MRKLLLGQTRKRLTKEEQQRVQELCSEVVEEFERKLTERDEQRKAQAAQDDEILDCLLA
jgi:inhibitor of KinA sporulation pathway (predicted exonuclease)